MWSGPARASYYGFDLGGRPALTSKGEVQARHWPRRREW